MNQKFLLLILVIIPTSLLLAGCAGADKVQESAATLKADVTEKVGEVKQNVDDAVKKVGEVKDKVIEKKNQIEDAADKVGKAVDSVNEASGAVKTVIGN